MEKNAVFKKERIKKIALSLVLAFWVCMLNFDGNRHQCRREFAIDTLYVKIGVPKIVPDTAVADVPDTAMAARPADVPLDIARLIGNALIVSTEGIPLDAALIQKKIDEEAARRADTSSPKYGEQCSRNMVNFNIADDWAQIITFKRKDDSFLVFLIQYYDWDEGYGIINSRYFIYDGERLLPTSNPLRRFPYLAGNKDTVGVKYSFGMSKSKQDPKRLMLSTVMKDVQLGKVEDVINAEFLWTGRDFIELASDHSLPSRGDIARIWQGAMSQEAEMPSQYARVDIDSDGNDEYIFMVNDGSLSKFAIFTYLNGKLGLIVGNYGTSGKEIKMLQGGYVVLADSVQTRHFHLMGSEIDGIYQKRGEDCTFKAGKGAKPEAISKDDYQKAIRRARRQILLKDLDWRPLPSQLAK